MKADPARAPSLRGAPTLDLRFAATSAVLMGLFYGACCYPHDPGGLVGRCVADWLRLQAHAAFALIALFDASAAVDGTVITGRFPLQVVKSCSALDVQALYLGSVLAFGAPAWTKALGVALGVPLLGAANVGRIAMLSFVGASAPEAFEAAHEEWLPLALVACACVGFAAWASWARSIVGRDG